MRVRSASGFTLIETIIVLAISSGLAMLAFTGYAQIQGQLRFSQATEGVKDFLTAQRTEINATIQAVDKDGHAVGTRTYTQFGRIMTLQAGGVIKERTLIMYTETPDAGTGVHEVVNSGTDSGANDIDYPLKWNARFNPNLVGTQIAFVRSPADGSLQTYRSRQGQSFTHEGGDYRFDNFDGSVAGTTTPLGLEISDGDRKATIYIDPRTNSISRQYAQ